MRSTRSAHSSARPLVQSALRSNHACTHRLSTSEKRGSSFAPTATTITATRLTRAMAASRLACDCSVFWIFSVSPTCSEFAPEHDRLNFLSMPATTVLSTVDLSDRWHQSPFSPSVPGS
jgi:hypothetical protein